MNVMIFLFSLSSIINILLLAAVRSGQVRVQIYHSSRYIIPVHSRQVLWQSEHRGQSLLAEFPILPSAKSVSDEVCGNVGV